MSVLLTMIVVALLTALPRDAFKGIVEQVSDQVDAV